MRRELGDFFLFDRSFWKVMEQAFAKTGKCNVVLRLKKKCYLAASTNMKKTYLASKFMWMKRIIILT